MGDLDEFSLLSQVLAPQKIRVTGWDKQI